MRGTNLRGLPGLRQGDALRLGQDGENRPLDGAALHSGAQARDCSAAAPIGGVIGGGRRAPTDL